MKSSASETGLSVKLPDGTAQLITETFCLTRLFVLRQKAQDLFRSTIEISALSALSLRPGLDFCFICGAASGRCRSLKLPKKTHN